MNTTATFCKRIALCALLSVSGRYAMAQPAKAYFDNGGVRARINADATQFYNYQDASGYEVPAGTGLKTIFASSLWLGAKTPYLPPDSNYLVPRRMAAQLYGKKHDFFPGPITGKNAPSPNPLAAANPADWNYVWKVTKAQVQDHIAHWNDAGYVMHGDIASWPGNSTGIYDPLLAPFVDLNSNQVYEPHLGEYPDIPGDQALFFVLNDIYGTHDESGGSRIGAEVQCMAYGHNSADPAVSQTLFFNYRIVNRSNDNWDSLYAGIATDFDIGCLYDDYVGTDVQRNMLYAFNGDAFDESCLGLNGYGATHPAQSITFLNQPLNSSVYIQKPGTGGSPPFMNDPGTSADYYQYLTGHWKDGTSILYGGTGHYSDPDAQGPACRYMFPGLSDPAHTGTSGIPPVGNNDWTMAASYIPHDSHLFLGSTGPYTVSPGGAVELKVAYSFYNSSDSTLGDFFDAVDRVKNQYEQDKVASVSSIRVERPEQRLEAWPNPLHDGELTVILPDPGAAHTLRVYDTLGRQVMERHNIAGRSIQLPASVFPVPGMYFVTVESGTRVCMGKISVQ